MVHVAHRLPSQDPQFQLLCLQKACFPGFNVLPNLRLPTVEVVVVVVARKSSAFMDDLLCCVFVSENPKRIVFFCIFMQIAFLCKIELNR